MVYKNDKANTIKNLRKLMLNNSFKNIYTKYENDLIELYSNINSKHLKDILKYFLINKDRSIFDFYNKTLDYFNIENFIKYKEYRKQNKKDTSSLNIFIITYGEIEGIKRYNDKCIKTSHTLEGYINKYGETEGIKRYKLYKDKNDKSHTLAGYIDKYGEIEGNIKWNNFCERNRYTNSLEYNILTYGEIEGRERYNKRLSIVNWNTKEAQENNKERYNRINNKMKHSLSKEGYLENNGEEALIKYLESKSNNKLETLIKRLGKEAGIKRYNELLEKYKYISSVDYYIDKYGKDEGVEKFKQNKLKCLNSSFVSKSSQDFFNLLYNKLKEESINTNKIYYKDLNTEYMLHYKDSKVFFYDWVDTNINLCIEYNGDLFHANPKIYNENDTPNPFNKNLSAKDIWEHDKFKNNILKDKRNIDVIIVWESDVKNNINNIIENIIFEYKRRYKMI